MENKPEPTLENLLEQIHKTLEIIQKHKKPIQLTPELLADINNLESAVLHFKEDIEELFRLFDMNLQDVKKEILTSPDMRSNDKQLIKRADDIEREARMIKFALSKVGRKGNKKGQTKSQSQGDKQKSRERQKLFKSIGGDKKWIPL